MATDLSKLWAVLGPEVPGLKRYECPKLLAMCSRQTVQSSVCCLVLQCTWRGAHHKSNARQNKNCAGCDTTLLLKTKELVELKRNSVSSNVKYVYYAHTIHGVNESISMYKDFGSGWDDSQKRWYVDPGNDGINLTCFYDKHAYTTVLLSKTRHT